MTIMTTPNRVQRTPNEVLALQKSDERFVLPRHFYQGRSNLEAKRRSGRFVGTRVVFGYMRSPDNKNQLVIDPEAASVVQEIFKWKVEGLSPAQIADQLNTANVPSPIEYKKAKRL